MKQQEHEHLCAYTHRFNAKVIEVSSTILDLFIRTFIQGLKLGDLFNSLVKISPTIFDGLLAKAEKYINMEEA